ncbi:MAG: glycosyltransferase [Methylotenera sp.]|nr:glycosyltransferase [Methylotenera sp.]
MVGKGSCGKDIFKTPFAVKTGSHQGGRLWREFSFWQTCVLALMQTKPEKYDLIQVRDMVSIGLLAIILAHFRGIKFVYWMSFLMSEGRIKNAKVAYDRGQFLKATLLWLKGLIERVILYRLVLPSATHVFVQSDAMARYVEKRAVPRSKLTAVPMGIELANLAAPTRASSGASEHLWVGYLGTLDAQRNLSVLIDALYLVRAQSPSIQLLLIGNSENPTDLDDLKAHAKEIGVSEAVEFTGWLPCQEGWRRLGAVDVCISPVPRGEIMDTGSPTKLVEYLALGLPSIGNDNPDQKAVLESSQAGWLVNEHSAASYATAILEVLGDLPAARRRAARGPDYVSANRSYAVISAMVADSYRKIVKD